MQPELGNLANKIPHAGQDFCLHPRETYPREATYTTPDTDVSLRELHNTLIYHSDANRHVLGNVAIVFLLVK